MMDVFDWIGQALKPRVCTSEEFLYDHMESQSDRCLPIIYEPFDVNKRSHWADRGSLFDYLYSTGGGKLLDFGPGDGWPSLILAPFVDEVIGVEGSHHRVQVCTENAKRLGISNARFIYVEPGTSLPFEDNSFDGVTAASSVEQTPDPYVTLQELYRVLRPGGRLRMYYEALAGYRDGQEREAWLLGIDDHTCRLMLYDRHVDQEHVLHYGLTLDMSCREATDLFSPDGSDLSFDKITVVLLDQVRPHIVDTLTCTLIHPSGKTLVSWLTDIGFQEVCPFHSGAAFVWQLFNQLQDRRPRDIETLDAFLSPIVRAVVQFAAPIEMNPMITAVK